MILSRGGAIAKKRRKTKAELMSIGKRILRIIGQNKRAKNISFDLIFLSDHKMLELKKRFLDKAGESHDVLSFAEPRNFPNPENKGRHLGEIYLNTRLLARFDKMVFLMIHGLLHLLGYTHNRKSDSMKMERMEKKMAKKVLDE